MASAGRRDARFGLHREVQYVAALFYEGRYIYSDKIAKFVCQCNRLSNGMVMDRLAQRFDHIFIDEVQGIRLDDLEILELALRAGIKLTLVGDHRQAVLRTNNSNEQRFCRP